MQQTKPEKTVELTPTQLKILESELTKPRKATGKQTVQAVARRLGINRTTYYRNLKKINNSDWKERQVERLKKLEGVVFAGLLHNIEKGNYDAIRDWYLRFAHLFTDRLELSPVQGMSDEELVEKAKVAILTAIAQKKLVKEKPVLLEQDKQGDDPCPESELETKPDFDGQGVA